MELTKMKLRVLVLNAIPQGGKPKDAVELVFKSHYMNPNVLECLLEEGYSVNITMEDRDVYVDADMYGDYCCEKPQLNTKATVKKSAPRRKTPPKPTPEPVEEVLELTPEPVATLAKKSRTKKADPAPEPTDSEEIIIED